jgi:hypothetical protein
MIIPLLALFRNAGSIYALLNILQHRISGISLAVSSFS